MGESVRMGCRGCSKIRGDHGRERYGSGEEKGRRVVEAVEMVVGRKEEADKGKGKGARRGMCLGLRKRCTEGSDRVLCNYRGRRGE